MSKLRFEKERNKNPIKNLGYYIALGLCLTAAGVTGWAALSKKSVPKQNPDTVSAQVQSDLLTEDWDAIADAVNAAVSGVPAETASSEATEAANTKPESKAEVSSPAAESAPEKADENVFTLPVSGKLSKSFSITDFIYSQTLEDWRTHEGIDITANKGDKVKTAGVGEVLDILIDDLMGPTVVIRHNNGLTAYYSGLSSKILVKKNQKIEAGTVLGTIDSVPIELVDPPHLHLGVKKDGDWVNPIEAMGLKIK
ncbi:MAG: M23 family metallopeptidase [Oscillospiraceae bacterium]|nr:M23 family metallopeptidase [Oscillospiraceae bacterium]